MFLKCWDQSRVELWIYFNLIIRLLEVFVVELYILKRDTGAYKNSNIMLVFLHYRVSKSWRNLIFSTATAVVACTRVCQHFIINYSFLVQYLCCFRTFSQVQSFLVLKLSKLSKLFFFFYSNPQSVLCVGWHLFIILKIRIA